MRIDRYLPRFFSQRKLLHTWDLLRELVGLELSHRIDRRQSYSHSPAKISDSGFTSSRGNNGNDLFLFGISHINLICHSRWSQSQFLSSRNAFIDANPV
jgi:hypothetical protein